MFEVGLSYAEMESQDEYGREITVYVRKKFGQTRKWFVFKVYKDYITCVPFFRNIDENDTELNTIRNKIMDAHGIFVRFITDDEEVYAINSKYAVCKPPEFPLSIDVHTGDFLNVNELYSMGVYKKGSRKYKRLYEKAILTKHEW